MNEIGTLAFTIFLAAMAANTVLADEVRVASSPAVPPYIIPEDNSGIEIDVVREAFAAVGHTTEFSNLPFPRVIAKMKAGEFDAALTISKSAQLPLGQVYYSDNHITFRNVAITLADRQLKIDSIADLAGKPVAAFEFAREYLGEDFATMANNNDQYREVSPNTSQLLPTLFSQRADAIVIEINIFKYHRKNKTFSVDTDQSIEVHNIFPANPFKVAFTSKKFRDDFNRGLAIIRESGLYQEILDKYTKQEN